MNITENEIKLLQEKIKEKKNERKNIIEVCELCKVEVKKMNMNSHKKSIRHQKLLKMLNEIRGTEENDEFNLIPIIQDTREVVAVKKIRGRPKKAIISDATATTTT